MARKKNPYLRYLEGEPLTNFFETIDGPLENVKLSQERISAAKARFDAMPTALQNYLNRSDLDFRHTEQVFNMKEGPERDQFVLKLEQREAKELERFEKQQAGMEAATASRPRTRYRRGTLLTGGSRGPGVGFQGKTLIGL